VCSPAGAVLASVSLTDLDRPYPELGYWVAPEARGQRVAELASRAACRWAFERGAPKVLWLADVGNEASWRVAHRIGFADEGRRTAEIPHGDGPRTDAWVASLLPAGLDAEPTPLRFDPFTPLVDGEVTLRRWRETDAEAYVALHNEPSVTRWNAAAPPLTVEAAAGRLRDGYVENWMRGDVARVAICVDDDTAVGEIDLRTPSFPPGTGELGWTLASAVRGRGIATRASRLMRDWAFDTLGLHRLAAGIDVENTPSQALAERLGFRLEGRHRQESPTSDGSHDDGLSYGMLASDVR
jgi:RimJ/RimL family protein N-acetyltransferase